MSDFEIPANIKQIGSIGDGLRIYMEDYVATYLKQYAESGGHLEKIAFLIGKHMVIDGKEHIFISGAIQGKFSEYEDGMEYFTDKSYKYAEEELKKHFNGYEVLGWMQSQPGYGVHLNPAYADYHMNNFTNPYNVLFVMDPVEKVNSFYIWNEKAAGIDECGGYFIYYEQNKGMQNYMLENKISKPRAYTISHSAGEEGGEAPDKTRTREFKIAKSKTRASKSPEGEAAADPPSPLSERPERKSAQTRSFAGSFSGNTGKARPAEDYKRMMNMLVSLCAVLFVICFIMGAGLIQSDGRIKNLEASVSGLDTAYVYMSSQIKQINSQPVFAPNQGETKNGAEALSEDDIEEDGNSGLMQENQSDGNLAKTSPSPSPAPASSSTPTPTPTPAPTPEASETSQESQTSQITPSDQAHQALTGDIPESYTVESGDSLYGISRKFYGNDKMVTKILEFNQLDNPDTIFVGQVLKLPKEEN